MNELHTYYWIDFFSLNTCKKGWECTCKQHDDGTGNVTVQHVWTKDTHYPCRYALSGRWDFFPSSSHSLPMQKMQIVDLHETMVILHLIAHL